MNNKNVRYISEKFEKSMEDYMTIIIGTKCRDSIIIGSDSQGNNELNGTKRLEKQKVFSLETDEVNSIYAVAGDEFLCRRLSEKIINKHEEIKKGMKIKTARDFADYCIENSIAELNKHYQHARDLSKNGLLRYRMLFGVVIKETQDYDLFLINPDGIASNFKDEFYTLGTKSELAEYIIVRLFETSTKRISEYNSNEILNFILYLIYQIKQFDIYCGGNTQYKQIDKFGIITDTNKKLVENFEKEKVFSMDKRYKTILDKILFNE